MALAGLAALTVAPLAGGRDAVAEGRAARARAALGAPTVTVRAGARVPLVRLYIGGPAAGVSLDWALTPHTQVVASADAGLFLADGARRYLGVLGAGVRVAPWRRGPWLQVGLGTTGHIERIGVVLPGKTIRSTDTGVVLTGDLRVGVSARRWEIAVGWDHILRLTPYYQRYEGEEELPFWGTAMAWVGRQL